MVQNSAAKASDQVLQKISCNTDPDFFTLASIKFRIQFKILVITFRALHGQAPAYIKELLQPCVTCRNTRSSDQGLLDVHCSRLKTKGDCAFEVETPKLWNSLPLDLRSVDTVDIFKKQLKTHLFGLAFV